MEPGFSMLFELLCRCEESRRTAAPVLSVSLLQFGLKVKGIDMGRAAFHAEKNDLLRSRRKMRRSNGETFSIVFLRFCSGETRIGEIAETG